MAAAVVGPCEPASRVITFSNGRFLLPKRKVCGEKLAVNRKLTYDRK
jgi:hypothetical protein